MHVPSSADVARWLMFQAKRDKWQFVVKTWRQVHSAAAGCSLCWLVPYVRSSVSFWTRLIYWIGVAYIFMSLHGVTLIGSCLIHVYRIPGTFSVNSLLCIFLRQLLNSRVWRKCSASVENSRSTSPGIPRKHVDLASCKTSRTPADGLRKKSHRVNACSFVRWVSARYGS